jgi:serine/threonine protein phosphatase PrpC
MIRFTHGIATSVGRVRRVNEDSALAIPPLYAVADGMGGHGSGDVASRLAVQTLVRCAGLRPLFVEAVLAALEEANRVIIDQDEADRMGTTVAGLAGLETAGGDHLMVFNVGDSRVYRLAPEGVEQLTVDHSEVQELVLAGLITREQARTHPRRNVVTRALGSAPFLLADHWLLPAIGGDRFLICSDGLFSELPDEVIGPLLAVGTAQHAAEALVAAANDAGGHDNVTAVVVDIDSPDDGGADETTMPRDQLAGRSRRSRGPGGARGPGSSGGSSGSGSSGSGGLGSSGGSAGPGGSSVPGGPGSSGGGQAALPVDVGLAGLGLIGPDPGPDSGGFRLDGHG